MAVKLQEPRELIAVAGVRLGAVTAGIAKRKRDDLVVIECDAGTSAAAMFTRNAFCAAPVLVAREHLRAGAVRCLLINAGNANAGTGAQGLADARACCDELARLARIDTTAVMPFSTGVIGEPLPMERMRDGIRAAYAVLREDGWLAAASAIMTTDTVAKGCSEQLQLSGGTVTLTGIAKGAGMIRPDMATMLAFIATDAGIGQDVLQRMLQVAVRHTFNRVTVDGDTSTNDACVLLATGASGVVIASDQDQELLQAALNRLCLTLAQALVRDGEGATKFVAIRVCDAGDQDEALQVAYTIAHSPLVKTALFASDANWGRVLAAVGRAGLAGLDPGTVSIRINDVLIAEGGERAAGYTEAAGAAAMAKAELVIEIGLGRGLASETVWTSDLSHEYVRINAEYRT